MDCWGYCWELAMDDFTNAIHDLWEKNPTHYWKVGGIRLWNREVGGIVECKTPTDLIHAMTVDSMWTMDYTVHDECIEYSLAHHDAPMGSASFVRIPTDDEIEDSRW